MVLNLSYHLLDFGKFLEDQGWTIVHLPMDIINSNNFVINLYDCLSEINAIDGSVKRVSMRKFAFEDKDMALMFKLKFK